MSAGEATIALVSDEGLRTPAGLQLRDCVPAHAAAGLAGQNPSVGAASGLARLPIGIFTTVMGLSGLAMVWARAHHLGVGPVEISVALRWATTGLYVLLFALFAVKCALHPRAVAAELAHPVSVTLFSAVPIGIVLLGTIWAEAAPEPALWVWGGGAALNLAFTLGIVSSWLFHPHYRIPHVSPAWFVPVVGNVVVPVAGVQFAPLELTWLFFSFGLVFWVVLMTIVIYRLVFHEPLPDRLAPTLFILIAPPAVAFLGYVALTGAVDTFARVLYYASLFFTLLLAINTHRFLRLRFSLSSWAYSFPLAAITLATFAMHQRTGFAPFAPLGWLLAAVATVVIGVLVVRTLAGAMSGAIFPAE